MRAKQTSIRIRSLRRRRLALALVAAMASPAAMAQSACTSSTACLPVDGVVTSGTITSTLTTGGKINNFANQSDTNLTITQTTRGGIIDWGSFNIGAGHALTFAQPVNGVTLNRVVGFGYGSGGCFTAGGCAPTQTGVFGNLSANGHVFIVNTAGITFGGSSQINVGGLVASTVDILDGDFLAGVTSNRYIFRGQSGTGSVTNNGAVTATKVGTTGGRVAFVGTDLYNDGTINANGGSVGFGAASSVTLDFLGDGLTQVTVNGLAASTVIATAQNYGDITADGGQILMRALVNPAGQGGVINGGTLRAQTLASRAGRVELTAPGGGVLLGDLRDGYRGPGIVDVSGNGGGLRGGSVWIDGATVRFASSPTAPTPPATRSASFVDASGEAGGGLVQINASTSLLMQDNTGIRSGSGSGAGGNVQVATGNLLMQGASDGAWMDASGATGGGGIDIRAGAVSMLQGTSLSADGISQGDGGTIRIQGTGDVLGIGALDANAGKGGGNGGRITILTGGDALVGNANARGRFNGNGGNFLVRAPTGGVLFGNVDVSSPGGHGGTVQVVGRDTVAALGGITADGGVDGGDVVVASTAGTTLVSESSTISANGGIGNGGRIGLSGAAALRAFGTLSAHGGTGGGQVVTASTGDLDIRGIDVDAGGGASAGTWTIIAPELTVLDGSDQGTLATALTGSTEVQDDDINYALSSGTSVSLRAGTDPADGGNIHFNDGVGIFYDDGTIPLAFRADAQGSITGSNFSITSNAAALSMAFNADANNLNNGFGYIDFTGATFDSNGGDIHFYGQSDTANGVASSYATGVRLANSSISSAGGNVLIRGASTGSDAGSDDAGVVLDSTPIDAGSGIVTIFGSGDGVTSGAALRFSGIDAGSVSIEGRSTSADGLVGDTSDITTAGDISLVGTGGARGVAFFGGLYTGGGNITVDGTGGAGDGIDITGPFDSAGGDVTMRGLSQQAKGLVFGGGATSGLVSAGGDILLTGNGVTGGVELQQSVAGPILLFAPSDVDTVNSAGGSLTVTGTASGAGAIGVYSNGVDLVGGAGDVTVDGSAPLGIGVLFANGAGVSTTTGAITLIGEGANFGLDIADGAIDTDSGEITLTGDALAPGATAGVRVVGGALSTNGGNILVTGTSAGGVGVQLGDGGAFAIGSGGGAIGISGTGVTAGVLMQGNIVDSGGGDIDVTGMASGTGGVGVDLSNAQLIGTSGDVDVLGNAAAGTGVVFGGKSGISTTTGAIGVTGIGATVGLALTGGTLSTDSGHFDLRGRGTGAASDGLVIGAGVDITTNGGGIELSGEGGSGAGVSLAARSSVNAGNSLVVIRAGNDGSSDALRIGGSIASALGVNLRPGGVDANGGLTERVDDGILVGGGGTGFALSGAELSLIDTPQLIIGSNLHAGAIQVLGGITRNGNLTLQNDGGTGGIALQAAVNVGGGVLALSSGGDISQTSAGAITAHSLLARAGGSVLLASANNNVAATTLAGSAGGDFEYQDVDALAIGNVSALGMDAGTNGLASVGASGISAGGDVFVRNLAGDLTLNANVSGTNIDLVTANTLQNTAGASLVASGDWRVWANSWVGESRGGLAGDGNLPNLYGCAYLGQCGVTVPGTDNHFIYVQQPTALITFDNFTREYGLPNPVFTFTVSGAILGDSAANVASGTGTTTATIGSNVGNYPITGNFTSAAGYRIQFAPGTLAITPAMLLFTADSFVRYLGTDNPLFTGSVTGFRNGDTVQSVFGNGVIWTSPAGILSPIGFYPINGGTSATNYVFSQAPGNATALQIIPLPQLSSTPIDLIRETVNTYVYDRNFGGAPMCAVNASLEDQQLVSMGDELSNEWSKVRSRPNLTNCFETDRKNSCGDF